MNLILPHLMFVPLPHDSAGNSDFWTSLVTLLIWIVPFAAAYIWHMYHDHKHNHHTDKKLDEIVELLKKIIEKK